LQKQKTKKKSDSDIDIDIDTDTDTDCILFTVPAILVDNIHDYTPYNEGTSHNSPVSGSSVAIMSGLASPVSPTNDSALLDYFWHRDFVDPTSIAR
jgi:hypothetical protein